MRIREAQRVSRQQQALRVALAALVCASVFAFAQTASATQGDLYAAGTPYQAATYVNHGAITWFGHMPDEWVVDINANAGDMGRAILAPEAGSVIVNSSGAGGNTITWISANGTEEICVGHLNDIVRWAGTVVAGEVIGHAGASGLADPTADHMHVVRRLNGSIAPLVLSGHEIVPAWWYNGNQYTSSGPVGGGGGGGHVNPIAPGDAGFTKGGNGWYPFSPSGGIYGTALFTFGSNGARDAWGRWTFDLSKLNGAANYKVEAYVTSTNAGHTAVDYHINARGGVQHRGLDQNAYSNQWVDLGTYTLDAGSAWVELDDQTTLPWADSLANRICFDGMRLTYVSPVVTPAALSMVGGVTLSPAPYSIGRAITGSMTVKNTGGTTGTWTPVVLAFRGPAGQNRDAVASPSLTLTPGQSATLTFSKTPDIVGSWTGSTAGCLGGTAWQSPGGGTVAFSVGPQVATPVYRFYNLKMGVHFYTASAAEMATVRDTLSRTYRLEGVAYSLNAGNPANNTALYRFYNLKKGVHFYTASEAEKATVIRTLSGTYRYEGVAYNVSLSPAGGATPVYRFYNLKQGVHFYTASEAEKDNVVRTLSSTYRLEGVGYYLAP